MNRLHPGHVARKGKEGRKGEKKSVVYFFEGFDFSGAELVWEHGWKLVLFLALFAVMTAAWGVVYVALTGRLEDTSIRMRYDVYLKRVKAGEQASRVYSMKRNAVESVTEDNYRRILSELPDKDEDACAQAVNSLLAEIDRNPNAAITDAEELIRYAEGVLSEL